MLSQFIEQYAESPRAKLFWAVIAVLVLAQMAAIYMLCTHQVQQSQQRDQTLRAQRAALTDCLQYSPDSTIGSCARMAGNRSAESANVPMGGVMTVSTKGASRALSTNASSYVSYR